MPNGLINPRPTTPPVVSYPQMKAQLRIDADDERDYILDLIDAASEYAEQALESSLLTRPIILTHYRRDHELVRFWDDIHHRRIYLPRGPVQSVTNLVDANNAAVAFRFESLPLGDIIVPTHAYTAPLTVTYQAGYGATPDNVPADIRMAIRSHVASLWSTREATTTDPMSAVPYSLQAFYQLKRRTAPAA